MEGKDLLVRLEQRSDGPLHVMSGPWYRYRYAYARSADTTEADEPGQDYLVYRDVGQTFLFAVCDGVGTSFFGDLGARLLGDDLVRWLAEQDVPADTAGFRAALAKHLSSELPASARQLVNEYQFTVNIDMLREYLETLRARGSEAMFVCGRLDQPSPGLPHGRIALAWLGDMRVALWGAGGQVALGYRPNTDERWSSSHGLIGGQPNVYIGPLNNPDNPVTRLVAYSDGFEVMDDRLEPELSNDELQATINSTRQQSGSDDVCYLEVWTKPVVERKAAPPPTTRVVMPPQPVHVALPPKPVLPPVKTPIPTPVVRSTRPASRYLLIAGLLGLLLGLPVGMLLARGGDPPIGEATPTVEMTATHAAAILPPAATPTAAPTITPTQPPLPTQTTTPSATPTQTITPTLTPPPTAIVTVPPPDNDSDGIADGDDLCPSISGIDFVNLEGLGCAVTDFDQDGWNDAGDLCPTEPGETYVGQGGRGCNTVDLDGDGVLDDQDWCPSEAGGPMPDPSQPGCPPAPSFPLNPPVPETTAP